MKRVLHVSSSETVGKLQSGKPAVHNISIETRLSWFERHEDGENQAELQNGPTSSLVLVKSELYVLFSIED